MISALFGPGFVFSYSYIPIVVVAATVLLVGIVTLLKNRFSGLYLSFLCFTVFVAAWNLTLVVLLSQTSPDGAQFWSKIILILMAFVPPNLYLFTAYLNRLQRQEAPYLLTSYLGTLIISGIILSSTYLTNGTYRYDWGYYPQFGELYPFYFLVFIGTLAKIIHVFYKGITAEGSSDVQVQRNKTLLYGTSIGYFGMVDYLPSFGVPVFPFGYIFVLGGIIVYAWAIWEYRLSGLTDDLLASEIFMTMDEFVMVTDQEGNISLANEKALHLLGTDEQTIKQNNVQRYLDDEILDQIVDTVDETDRFSGETVFVDHDGAHQYTVQLRVSKIGTSKFESERSEDLLLVGRDVTELRETEDKLNRLTYQNDITGLPNEKLFERKLENNDLPANCKCSAYFIVQDIRDVKNRMTEEEYREFIQSIADRIGSIIPNEHLYQFEINEFFVFDENSHRLQEMLQQNFQQLKESFQVQDQTYYVNFSIGLTENHPLDTAREYGREAAVDVLHRSGTDISRYSEEISEENKRFFELKHDILRGIQEDLITVNFHPQMRGDSIRGVEVLVRWFHDEFGFIEPPKIIQAAVEMDHEGILLEHILSTAFEAAEGWDNDQVISFNLAAKQLQYEDRLLETISNTAREYNLPLDSLEMELTEQAAVQNIDDTVLLLKELRNMGLSIAIDDFGTGFSSLKSLIQLPIDYLKIDKSFVLNLYDNQKNQEIVETTIQLAQNLGLEVIAEGVETEDHIDYLERNGCDILQGFYWTSPLSPEDYREFFDEFNTSEVSQ